MSSAKHGGLGHWKSQRISSVLLVPLILWLLWAFTQLAGADYAAAAAFFRSPLQAILAILTAGVLVYHAQSGVTVVVEDYLYPPWLQQVAIWLTRIGCLVGFLATVYTIYVLWQGG
jgi:succinate dehydrogenase / fumarate reductase membrane anchor subunit